MTYNFSQLFVAADKEPGQHQYYPLCQYFVLVFPRIFEKQGYLILNLKFIDKMTGWLKYSIFMLIICELN